MSKNFKKLENLAGELPESPKEGHSHLTYTTSFFENTKVPPAS